MRMRLHNLDCIEMGSTVRETAKRIIGHNRKIKKVPVALRNMVDLPL
jgi:hypothetical protein